MGMFDTVKFPSPYERYCLEGHKVFEFQTKSMDATMDRFHVLDGHLFSESKKYNNEEVYDEDKHILSRHTHLDPCDYTGKVIVYTRCKECRPVYAKSERSFSGDMIHGEYPWVELQLEFDHGVMLRCEHTPESHDRVTLRAHMMKNGMMALPDDHYLVQAHEEKLKAQGKTHPFW